MKTAFDSGAAQNLEVAYENRGESMSIVLPEAAAAGTEVIVKIDGVDVGLAQANGDNATSEWTIDVKDWMSAANVVDKKLPLYTTESVITVEYTDRVGNTMVYTTYPTKSRAQRSISMYVDPNPVYNTVGEKEAMKLELYGKAVAYEDLLVTIGGRSYRVTAKGEGDYDHKTTGRWSLTVDLSEIDFPVDVPTALTVKYVNMTSGSAEVELTYKSWCQPVAVASPFAAGQKVIYGFCEPSSIVEITVNDTVYSNIATGKEMFRFGTVGGVSYYAFELADAMKAGDVISIQYTDFVDNESDVYTVTVPETFDGMTKAQPLGANLVERLEGADGEFYADQRFVTPVEVSEGAEIEVPVLAYAGYQVGTMTAKVADGQLVFDYAIDEDCAYEGAGYTLRVYTEKPSLEDVLADESASLDIAAPVAIEEGVATVWVYAEFDVNVPAERIANGTGYVELRGIDDEAVVDFGMADELYEMYKRFQGIR